MTAQWITRLLCKHEDLEINPWDALKEPGMLECPVISGSWGLLTNQSNS